MGPQLMSVNLSGRNLSGFLIQGKHAYFIVNSVHSSIPNKEPFVPPPTSFSSLELRRNMVLS